MDVEREREKGRERINRKLPLLVDSIPEDNVEADDGDENEEGQVKQNAHVGLVGVERLRWQCLETTHAQDEQRNAVIDYPFFAYDLLLLLLSWLLVTQQLFTSPRPPPLMRPKRKLVKKHW